MATHLFSRRIHRFVFFFITSLSLIAILASMGGTDPVLVVVICWLLGVPVVFTLFHARSRRQMVVSITANLILLSVALVHWPLRIAYGFMRPSLNEIAERVRAGNAPQAPFWVGPFYIRKAEISLDDVVCLWTDDNPGAPAGFVQHGPDDLPFNIWSHIKLDQSWQFISED